jgi:hypothetical protein
MLQFSHASMVFMLSYILINVLFVEGKSIVEFEKSRKRAQVNHQRRNQKRDPNTTKFRYNTTAASRAYMTQKHISELTHEIAFIVDSLPDITDDPGEMYSGMISIDDTDPTAQMFFVFEPTIGEPVNEITIWLNGVRLQGNIALIGSFYTNIILCLGTWVLFP